jgi:hypothetical protein
MRATLIGRFLLLSILWLVVLLLVWYFWATRWLAAPPIWLAGTVMKMLFGWVDNFEQHGVTAVLNTLVQIRVQGPDGVGRLGELVSTIEDTRKYGYGLVLLWAMLLSSRPQRWWLKGLIGSVILFAVQAWGICFEWLIDVVVLKAPNGSTAYLHYPDWVSNAVAYGYQLGFLILPPVVPIMLWLLFNKRFVAALWLEAALENAPGKNSDQN